MTIHVWWDPIILGSAASLAFGPIDNRLGLGNINRPHTSRVRIGGRPTASTDSVLLNFSPRAASRLSMSFEPRKTWYVSFELPKPKRRGAARRSPRLSETFLTENEAKAFAREKYNQGLIVSAGTLNPHLPRRTIPSAVIHRWIEDVSECKGSGVLKLDADFSQAAQTSDST